VTAGISVFISYARESSEHLAWVTHLAARLEVLPDFVVVVDRYDLHAGKDLTHFMERGVAADRVVVVVTPQYVQKARDRRGGVGYESSIISADVLRDQLSGRVVPALRVGDELPDFLKSKVFVDFRDDSAFETSLDDLTAALCGVTPAARPTKGARVAPPSDHATQVNAVTTNNPKPTVVAFLPRDATEASEYFGPIEIENIGDRDALNIHIADVSNGSQLAHFDPIPRLRPGERIEVTPVIDGAEHTRSGFADLYEFAWVAQIGRACRLEEGEQLDGHEIRRELARDFVAPIRISYHDAGNQNWVTHCELVFGRVHTGLHRLRIEFRRVEPA
jgi:hypothetical protein